MKCIGINDQKLIMTERPTPKPKAGEVLVKVYAAGVNRPDLMQRKGLYPPPEGVTDIPGLEISGEIAERGRDVKGLKNGQQVCALVSGGGYAEYCIVPAEQCLPMPKGMDFITAAGIPETFFTVWTNLFDGGRLQKGETVLIHGGASGIGTAAIQIARAAGAKVFVTAGSEEKCRACKKLGAHLAINYNTEDFVTEVMKATKDRGVDVVLDMVGGDYIPRNLKLLAPYGRHVSIAVQHGKSAEVDILQIMQKRLTITGSTLRPRSTAEKGAIAEALYMNVWSLLHRKNAFWSLFSKKRITPVIDKVFPFADAQAAHEYLEAGDHIGKVILRVM
jgi:putative PIG3 family NAD(P)H quinone oxidoreductase